MIEKKSLFKKILLAVLGLAALICIIAVSLPKHVMVMRDAKLEKAGQDCETLVQCILRYESREKAALKSLMDLHGKYITNIDTLKDPWNNEYQLDTEKKKTT